MNAHQPIMVAALRPSPRRGLRREEAASYVGVGSSKFDQLVAEGKMPRPFRIDGCVIWDIRALDAAFDAISGLGDVDGDDWNFAP
ncbi:helix-turn-helix transcriptional regulator [Kaistia adipata]|uniref:helix-turn-helix transcriptional regulator n=1 Tax=Kaistia adipata TaxID=166954 RepID=UPI001FE12B69|nr:XRE family transcriptional regulator [Kaistia adipata]